jgi:ATP-binding cassette subfamily B (MDR/TAP) protein 9
VFSKLLLQPVDFFDAEEVGALTSRLASDCQAVARALSGNFNVAWRNALQCIGALFMHVLIENLYVCLFAPKATEDIASMHQF